MKESVADMFCTLERKLVGEKFSGHIRELHSRVST